MNKEKLDSNLELMDDILDSLEKEPSHNEDDYKSLEQKYNEEVSKREKIENDYQNLYQKYKDRFTDTVSNYKSDRPSEKTEVLKEEPKEEVVLDIRSIF